MQRPLLAIALLLTLTASAEALTLGTFTGHLPCGISGPCDPSNPAYVSGTFFLDETATWDLVSNNGIRGGFLRSPSQTIAGQFGEYTFEASPHSGVLGTTPDSPVALHVADFPEFMDFSQDFWILRSAVAGPVVNGVSPTIFSLFIWAGPNDARDTVSIYPPFTTKTCSPNFPCGTFFDFSFQYLIAFSDNSFVSGTLSTVQVPDASATWSMMLIAGLVLLALRRHTSRAEKQPNVAA